MVRNGSTKGSAGRKGAAPAARKTDIRWSEGVWEALGREAEVSGVSRAAVVKGIVERSVGDWAPAALGEGSSGLPERVAASVQEASAAPPAALDGPGAYERHVAGEDAAFEASMGGRPAAPAASRLLGPFEAGRQSLEWRVAVLVAAQFGVRMDNEARARRWIEGGKVRVDGLVRRDPSLLVDDKAEVSV